MDLARLKDSFPVSFSVAFWGLFIRTCFFFLDLSPSRRRALAQATKPRRCCLAKPPHGCAAASSRLTSRPRLRAPAQPRSAALASPRLRAQSPLPSRAAAPKLRRSIVAKAAGLRLVLLPFSPIDWYGKFCVSILISNCDLDQILNALIPHCIQGI